MSFAMYALWRWTFQGGVFIVMVLLLRLLLLDRLPKQAFTVLWTAAMVQLLIPTGLIQFSYSSRFGLNVSERAGEALIGAARYVVDNTGLGAAPRRLALWANQVFQIGIHPMQMLYFMGAAVCAAAFLAGHLRGRRVYAESLPADDPFVTLWCAENPMDRPVQIRVSDRIAAPLTYGVFHPVVLLPRTMDGSDRETLAYVLAHEFHHIRRYDTLRKWGFAAALCVHWFNPLVWAMYALANRDLELDCDEEVADAFSWGSRSGYARTLIALEERRGLDSPFVSHFSQSTLEARVKALTHTKPCGALHLAAAVLVAGTLAMVCGDAAGTVALSAPAAEQEAADYSSEAVVIGGLIDGDFSYEVVGVSPVCTDVPESELADTDVAFVDGEAQTLTDSRTAVTFVEQAAP